MTVRFATVFATAWLTATLAGGTGAASEHCPHCAASPGRDGAPSPSAAASPFITEWISPDKRKAAVADFRFENQDGAKISFSDLRGTPTAMSFIYTRCQNQRKCPLVAKTMAKLQTAADQSHLSSKPRLLLVSYDPEFDTPALLKNFGAAHGFHGTDNAMLLRPESRMKERLIESLNVAVNYDEQRVNVHGLQLILFDKQGRLVRRYHSLLWDNADVLSDLSRLAAE